MAECDDRVVSICVVGSRNLSRLVMKCEKECRRPEQEEEADFRGSRSARLLMMRIHRLERSIFTTSTSFVRVEA